MNRFEALHTLGLDEDATDDDVRLAFYGMSQAIKLDDYAADERIHRRMENLLDRSKESRDFLLNNRNKTAARRVVDYTSVGKPAPKAGKVSVSATEEKTIRLHGMDMVRGSLLAFYDQEQSRRFACVWALVACIVIGFLVMRYLRGMPRIIAFCVLSVVAVAGSTLFTTAHLQVRAARRHIAHVDEDIRVLREELGLTEDDAYGYDANEDARQEAAETADDVQEKLDDLADVQLDADDAPHAADVARTDDPDDPASDAGLDADAGAAGEKARM